MNEEKTRDRTDRSGRLIELLVEKRIISRRELVDEAERLVAGDGSGDSPYLADALIDLLKEKGIVNRSDLAEGP